MDQRKDVLPEQFLWRISQDALHRRTLISNRAIGFEDSDQIRSVLDQQSKMLLPLPEFPLSSTACITKRTHDERQHRKDEQAHDVRKRRWENAERMRWYEVKVDDGDR